MHYLFNNDNWKRIKKIVRKNKAKSQRDLMPLLRDEDPFQYEEW